VNLAIYAQAWPLLITSDGFGDEDLSGLSKTRYVWKGSLSQLLKKHRAMLEASDVAMQPFTEETAADALEAMRREQTDRLVQLRLVRWLDDKQSQWRYTVIGGLRTTVGTLKQLGVALSQIWRGKTCYGPTADEVQSPLAKQQAGWFAGPLLSPNGLILMKSWQ